MSASKVRIVTDQSGNLQMIIHPDDDAQLGNVPEFSPQGSLIADVLKSDYDAVNGPRDVLALLQPILNAKSRVAGILYQAKIEAIDVSAAIDADVAAAEAKVSQAIKDGVIPSPAGTIDPP